MKNFFLLSGTGRMKRGEYFLNLLIAGAFGYIADIENMPGWLSLILLFISLGWAIYTISARLHDLGYPGWIAWIRLGLQILPLFGEIADAIARLCCLCLGLTLLFSKGQERDNEYGLNPYLGKGKGDSNKEKVENIEQKVELEEKDIEQKEKKVVKNKTKTAKSKKNK